MLYLAEVIKQSRLSFMGGLKTELKLLACQHNDQTWSAIPTEEIIATEQVEQSIGDGALMVLQLGLNKQIQEIPQLAGTELVRQLQRLSRLSEKLKDQQDEIEQWKQSLTYQSQELSRRELEIEARFEQLEEMEQEFQQMERRGRDIEEAEERLIRQQQQLDEMRTRYGLSVDLPPEQMLRLQTIINRLAHQVDNNDVPWQYNHLAIEVLNHQKNLLLGFWEQLRQGQAQLEQRKQIVEQQGQSITLQKQELKATQQSLDELKVQVQVQQTILNDKQDLLSQINVNQQTTEDLRDTLSRLGNGGLDTDTDPRIDTHALEKMPLGELEKAVNQLKEDLDKIVRFVNDQEEELSFQIQTVNELQQKLDAANDYDHLTLERELGEEQEVKRMLDETLVGQRRNLKERQKVFMGHLRILRRRQGVIDLEEPNPHQMNLEPLLNQLEALMQEKEEERLKVEGEIERLRSSLSKIKDSFNQQQSDYQKKHQELEQAEQSWQQNRSEILELETHCRLYQETLQPIQDDGDKLGQLLEGLAQWFIPSDDN